MAFTSRIDYFGKGAGAVLVQVSDSQSSSYAVNATAPNERGDVVARDLGGLRDAPTVDYVVKAAGNVEVSLGAVNTVSSKVYCLLGLSISTKAGTPPTVQMSGESLQDGATVSSTVTVPAIAIASLHKAQILAAAFTITGDGCKLTECGLEVKANLTRATKDGDTVAHDVHGASIVVSGKVVQSGATPPVITAGDGYELTQPQSQDNPDEGYTEWTFEATKDLVSVEPVSE